MGKCPPSVAAAYRAFIGSVPSDDRCRESSVAKIAEARGRRNPPLIKIDGIRRWGYPTYGGRRETKLQSQANARLLLVEKMRKTVLAYGDYFISVQGSTARNEWKGKKILSQPLGRWTRQGDAIVTRTSKTQSK